MEIEKKFLYCFPLRTGNFVFSYIVTVISLGMTLVICPLHIAFALFSTLSAKRGNFDFLEEKEKLSPDRIKILTKNEIISGLYVTAAIDGTIFFLLSIFGIMYVVGVHKKNGCLVRAFFVYSIFHLLVSLVLINIDILSGHYICAFLWIIADIVHCNALVGVHHFARSLIGNIYHHQINDADIIYKA